MPVALEVQSIGQSRRHRKIRYKATFTGVYPAGGDTADLTAATNPKNLPMAFLGVFPTVDQVNFLDSLAGNDPEWVVGTTLANGKIKLWGSAANDHAAGAYAASELADSLYFEIEVPVGK